MKLQQTNAFAQEAWTRMCSSNGLVVCKPEDAGVQMLLPFKTTGEIAAVSMDTPKARFFSIYNGGMTHERMVLRELQYTTVARSGMVSAAMSGDESRLLISNRFNGILRLDRNMTEEGTAFPETKRMSLQLMED